MKGDTFYIKFADNYFYKGNILTSENNVKMKVLQDPHKKWWKQLFQFITFGLYKAPTQYKCRVIEND